MKTPQRHRRHRQPRADGGFVLLEAIVSIALITILMTALTALFVSTMKVTNHQRTNQSAVRLATDLMDQARAQGVKDCTGTGAPTCPALQVLATQPAPTISSITYTPTYALSWCDVPATGVPSCGNSGPKPFVQVAVTLTWSGSTCAPSGCTYQTSMVLSAAADPVFVNG
jgi:type II secretory pathway pseudopilin PulG